MSLRENKQMNLDTEGGTHTGMGAQSRSSHKLLLLQVWCGLLTVSMVVMAALLISIKPKSAEDKVSTGKTDNVSQTVGGFMDSIKSTGSSPSYIQLFKPSKKDNWQASLECQSCSLVWRNGSVHCEKKSLYFIYAQVTFSQEPTTNEKNKKSVVLKRDPSFGKTVKKLVEGTFPHTTDSSVWVAKIVDLAEGDSVSLEISGDILTENTFWGVYQLH